jgi:hypothetical protein
MEFRAGITILSYSDELSLGNFDNVYLLCIILRRASGDLDMITLIRPGSGRIVAGRESQLLRPMITAFIMLDELVGTLVVTRVK